MDDTIGALNSRIDQVGIINLYGSVHELHIQTPALHRLDPFAANIVGNWESPGLTW